MDQLPRIDVQLAQSQQVVSKYSALGASQGLVTDDKELDQFVVCIMYSNFIKLLLILNLISFPFCLLS